MNILFTNKCFEAPSIDVSILKTFAGKFSGINSAYYFGAKYVASYAKTLYRTKVTGFDAENFVGKSFQRIFRELRGENFAGNFFYR